MKSRVNREVLLIDDVVFFFQAEDGIRDYKVTGVQTCALPISMICTGFTIHKIIDHWLEYFYNFTIYMYVRWGFSEIGRASCRERV